jgi:hypothetical protein
MPWFVSSQTSIMQANHQFHASLEGLKAVPDQIWDLIEAR